MRRSNRLGEFHAQLYLYLSISSSRELYMLHASLIYYVFSFVKILNHFKITL